MMQTKSRGVPAPPGTNAYADFSASTASDAASTNVLTDRKEDVLCNVRMKEALVWAMAATAVDSGAVAHVAPANVAPPTVNEQTQARANHLQRMGARLTLLGPRPSMAKLSLAQMLSSTLTLPRLLNRSHKQQRSV